MNKTRKRLFIFLMAFSLLILVLIFTFAWWLVSKQYLIINQIILTFALVFFILLFSYCRGLFFLVIVYGAFILSKVQIFL